MKKFVFILIVCTWTWGVGVFSFAQEENIKEPVSIKTLQEFMRWVPDTRDRNDVLQWYFQFLSHFRGGSLYDLSPEEVLSVAKSIPEELRTPVHLGIHDIAGIRPFHFTVSENPLIIPKTSDRFFEKVTESLVQWLNIFETQTLEGLLGCLKRIPPWMEAMEGFKGEIGQDEVTSLKTHLGKEESRPLNLKESEALLSKIYDQMKEQKSTSLLLRRTFFSVALLTKMVSRADTEEILRGTTLRLEEKIERLHSLLSTLLKNEFKIKPGDKKSHSREMLANLLGQLHRAIEQKSELKERDRYKVEVLVSNGFAGLFRANFTRLKLCIGRAFDGKYQHRSSSLYQHSILLLPMIHGELRGYVELTVNETFETAQPVLVLKTIQFEDLTPRGALLFFSHLSHQAKQAGFWGLALPTHLEGKTDVDDNNQIMRDMIGSIEIGTPITVTALDKKEWPLIQKTFGVEGSMFYDEDRENAYILLNPHSVLDPKRFWVHTLKEDLGSMTPSKESLIENLKRLPDEVFLAIGLSLKYEDFSAFFQILNQINREKIPLIVNEMMKPHFFERVLAFFKNGLSAAPIPLDEEDLKNRIEYIFRAIHWEKWLAYDRSSAIEFLKQCTQYLGRERFLRSSLRSLNVRCSEIWGAVPLEWMISFLEKMRGYEANKLLQWIKILRNQLSVNEMDRIQKRVSVFLRDSSNEDLQCRACYFLASGLFIPDEENKKNLIRLVHDKNPSLQASAVGALGMLSEDSGIKYILFSKLDHTNMEVKAAAIQALGKVTRDEQVRQKLLDLLLNPNENIRRWGIISLKTAVTYDAVKAGLLRIVQDQEECDTNRKITIEILSRFDNDAEIMSVFLTLLKSEKAAVCIAAIDAVSKYASQKLEVRNAILSSITSSDPMVRMHVIMALRPCILNSDIKTAIIERLKDNNPLVYGEALRTLSGIIRDSSVRQVIFKMSEDKDALVRKLSMVTLLEAYNDPEIKQKIKEAYTKEQDVEIKELIESVYPDLKPPSSPLLKIQIRSEKKSALGGFPNDAFWREVIQRGSDKDISVVLGAFERREGGVRKGLEKWFEVLSHASDAQTAQMAFEGISRILDQLSPQERKKYLLYQIQFLNTPSGTKIMAHIKKTPLQMGLSGAHFGLALFIKHVVQNIFEIDRRPMDEFLGQMPLHLVDYFIFSCGSALGRGAYGMSGEMAYEFYKVLIYRKLLLSRASGSELSKQFVGNGIFSNYLKRQAAFLAGLSFAEWIHTGKVDEGKLLQTWVSFSLAGAVVEVGTEYVLLRWGKRVWRLKAAGGPWGFVITALELGLTMVLADGIECVWDEVKEKGVHQAKMQRASIELFWRVMDERESLEGVKRYYENEFLSAFRGYREFKLRELQRLNAQYVEGIGKIREIKIQEYEKEMNGRFLDVIRGIKNRVYDRGFSPMTVAFLESMKHGQDSFEGFKYEFMKREAGKVSWGVDKKFWRSAALPLPQAQDELWSESVTDNVLQQMAYVERLERELPGLSERNQKVKEFLHSQAIRLRLELFALFAFINNPFEIHVTPEEAKKITYLGNSSDKF